MEMYTVSTTGPVANRFTVPPPQKHSYDAVNDILRVRSSADIRQPALKA